MTQSTSQQDRVMGALMGAFIGDALALGPHWFYDLNELRQTYGDWITDYTNPKEGRYHSGLKAGDSSQSGVILALLLQSLVDKGEHDANDFCERLDLQLFAQLDGTPMNGPGGYTSQSIREAWRKRQAGLPWGQVAGLSDNTEAAERCLAIAVRYAKDPARLAKEVSKNTALTQNDPTVLAMTTAYCLVLGQLVAGEPLDGELSNKLMALTHSGQLPFHTVTQQDLTVSNNQEKPRMAGEFASPDALLTVGSIAKAAQQKLIEPAWKASIVYGMPCAVYHQFPAAYYLAAYFQDDVEGCLLHAVNGGGQNQARAILAGALSGAIGGIQAIPSRFIEGLAESKTYLALAKQLADQTS